MMTAPNLPKQLPGDELVDPLVLAYRVKQRKRRWLMFWISLPFALCVLAVAVKLISLSLFTTLSISSYEERDYPSAVEHLSPLDTINRFEPYKVHFNRGTAQLKQRKYEASEKSLKEAVELAPEPVVCDVRRNLAHVYTGQADAAMDKNNFLGAIRLLEKSIKVLDVPECADDQETQDQKQETEDQKDQSEDKQEEKEEEQKSQEGGEGQDPAAGGQEGQEPGGGGQEGQEPGSGGDQEGQGGQEPGGDQEGQGGAEGGQEPGGGGGESQPGQGGGSQKDQLEERNNQAQKERDKERQKSNTGKGPRKTW